MMHFHKIAFKCSLYESSGSQPRGDVVYQALFPQARGTFRNTRGAFLVVAVTEVGLIACSGQDPEMLNVLKCSGPFHSIKDYTVTRCK